LPQEIWIELIRGVVPNVTAVLLLSGLLVAFRGPIQRDVLPRLGTFKGFGLELTFVRAELDKAAATAPVKVSSGDKSSALLRAQRVAPLLVGARILWIDDRPQANSVERNILSGLGILVDTVQSSDEARAGLKKDRYDLVISDVDREGRKDEGIKFLKEMWEGHFYRWTVLYVRKLDLELGTPPHAFAITNRPDHLLHYVMDILERERAQ